MSEGLIPITQMLESFGNPKKEHFQPVSSMRMNYEKVRALKQKYGYVAHDLSYFVMK